MTVLSCIQFNQRSFRILGRKANHHTSRNTDVNKNYDFSHGWITFWTLTFLLRVNSLFYMISSLSAWCVSHRELSLSLLCQTSGRIDPGKINMPLDDFKCSCFLLSWGYKGPSITAVSPPSLTDAKLLNYMIKGCHRERKSNAMIPVSSRPLTLTASL